VFVNDKLGQTYFNVFLSHFLVRILYVFYREKQNMYYMYGRTMLADRHITSSHYIEMTDAGLDGLCIREI